MLRSNVLPGVQCADIYTLTFNAMSLLVVGGMCAPIATNWCPAVLIDALVDLLWNKRTLGVQDYGLR